MTDDLFGHDDADEAAELYATCHQELVEVLEDFAEDYELGDEQIVDLLLDIAVSFRTVSYFEGVERPSASGMKLDLDRLRREFDDLVRAVKKEADTRIALYQASALEALEGEDEQPEK
jgi:hypothetical protein